MARTFSGTGQFLGKASALATAVPISLATWVNRTAVAGDVAVLYLGESGSANIFMLDLNAGTPRASSKAAGVFVAASSAGGALTASTWYHLVAVFASITSRIIYVNGVSQGSNATSNTPVSGSFTSTQIAALQGGSLHSGIVAFSGFWNVGLSAADAVSLSAGASPRLIQPSSLLGYARMTGGTSPEPDYVSSTGWTLTGSPTEVANPLIYYP